MPVRFVAYQAARLDRAHGQADLVYRGGTFFLYCTLNVPEPSPGEIEDYLGIDLSIVNLASDSDGTLHAGAMVEHHRRVYVHGRGNLQRKGTRAALRELRAPHHGQARYQADTNRGIAKHIVAVAKGTARGIAQEALGGICARTTFRRRQRARHANWAFAQLRGILTYKARAWGVPVIAVDPRNTGRECPTCSHVEKANRAARDRFRCIWCGLAGLPDAFAARVIAARARAAVMRPMVSTTGDPVPVVPGTSRRL